MNARSKRLTPLDSTRRSAGTGGVGRAAMPAVCFALLYAVGSGPLAAAEPPPVPSIVELSVFPAKLELNGIRDSRRILVSGRTADGQLVDLTLDAKLVPEGDAIVVEADGYVSPRKEGAARLAVSAAGNQIVVPVEV